MSSSRAALADCRPARLPSPSSAYNRCAIGTAAQVQPDNPPDALDQLAWLVQLTQNAARHALALVIVAVKRNLAVLDVLGRGLGDVVQQGRPTQGEARRGPIENLQRVREHVFVATVAGLVVHATQYWNVGQAELSEAQIAP